MLSGVPLFIAYIVISVLVTFGAMWIGEHT